jgi:hypothetical protein
LPLVSGLTRLSTSLAALEAIRRAVEPEEILTAFRGIELRGSHGPLTVAPAESR